ncbi:hypothetical protein LTR53_016485 [Teratosphaeriaceae sp. CCFEE 6253]|nr:hypothetical protein LTR53_016485 [Teratosphaeriaceae sp. CCFEE 6253]
MSDSGLSTAASPPADSRIEQCLRRIVRDALKADEEITISLARTRAETELGLDADFLKNDDTWKRRSKDLIRAAVDDPQSPEKARESAPKLANKKRKSDEPPPTTKRRKQSVTPQSEGAVSDASESADRTDPTPVPATLRGVRSPKHDDAVASPDRAASNAVSASRSTQSLANDDESDLSSVIDEPPPKKKRGKKATSLVEAKNRPQKTAKPPKPAKELTPDDEEIKRLQGWLVKCGIRKVWGKELKPFDKPKQKIKHLKALLEEAGMTGRYSNDKAQQIKEARELAADIEATKDFNEKWGQHGGDDGGEEDEDGSVEGTKPRRLMPKGLIDFGDSGDEGSD